MDFEKTLGGSQPDIPPFITLNEAKQFNCEQNSKKGNKSE